MKDLSSILEDLLSEKITPAEAADIIKSKEVQKSINYLAHVKDTNPLIPYTQEDLQFINDVIKITQFIYNNTGEDTGISDTTYDILYEIMLVNGGPDIISAPVPRSHAKTGFHKYPELRGTLTKVFYLTLDEERKNKSRRYLDEWIKSMENKIYQNSGLTVDLNEEEIYVFPKFDGLSVVEERDENNEVIRDLTRGFTETNEAQDITNVMIHYPRKYKEYPGSYGIKYEAMIREKDLAYYNKKFGTTYKNSRSIAAAILNSDEYDDTKARMLVMVPLRVSNGNGNQELATEVFKEYPFLRCRLKDRERIRNFAYSHRYIGGPGGLRTDGAVIYIINEKLRNILGRENHINNYEVAYKFTEESALSTLKDVEFQSGLFGRITPVANIDPVVLKGNTIQNISLGSIGRFNKMHLCKGDTVKILYDIIPYMIFDGECSHNGGELIQSPKWCPECGNILNWTESADTLFCNNPDCPGLRKGKILNFLNKMRIDGMSYAIVDKLYRKGFLTKIEDIYSLEDYFDEIVEIDGFGKKMVRSWLDNIKARNTMYDYEFLGAIGIPGISKKTFEKVFRIYTLDELFEIVENNELSMIIKVPGIHAISAGKIIDGIKKNRDAIDTIMQNITVFSSHNFDKPKFKVCFTKIRDTELEELIQHHGGQVSDSVTKDTTVLVVPSMGIESSKVNKAKKYNVPIVDIDKFRRSFESYVGLD